MICAQKRILVLLMCGAFSHTASARVQLGIDVLQSQNFALLRGKRVGLVTNQTGVNSAGERTRLILHRAPQVKLVALYTPEHGLDGKELAGKYVASRKDSLTGVMAYSLYGPTRKPTAQMLKGIDVLVYDMQDIGCRSYTYVSTMIKCMEAAGENGIEFVVLDRPNPLGGLRVEGPPIEKRWISFVGQIPVPYVHGMTVGEIAQMANDRGWMEPRCRLSVVSMRGWNRRMVWDDTGLRWVRTSPNIPNSVSPAYYVVTGLVGSLAGLETGVGGSTPFEIAAAKWLSEAQFTSTLQSLRFPDVLISPYSAGGFRGAKLRIDPRTNADLCALAVHVLAEINKPARPNLFARSTKKLDLFYKVYGSDSIRSQLEKNVPVERIVASWTPNNSRFRAERERYLLY